MKKVRFETPDQKFKFFKMNEGECHSPRPLIERQIHGNIPDVYNYPKVLPYSNDPVQLFERSNSSPYPTLNKTDLQCRKEGPNWSPSNDLELSMLDASYHEPRRPKFCRSILKPTDINNHSVGPQTLSSIENQTTKSPNILIKDNDFFIRRGNLDQFHLDMNPIHKQLNKLSLDKENDPLAKKTEIMQMAALSHDNKISNPSPDLNLKNQDCRCHHCIKDISSYMTKEQTPQQHIATGVSNFVAHNSIRHTHCPCALPPQPSRCSCCDQAPPTRQYQCKTCDLDHVTSPKLNAVDKKTWALEKYEQSKKSPNMELEKQTNITKEKREPTVSDLFKIIKLQNEQLQLLQEKVDKFISASQQNTGPVQKCMSEHVAIETVGNEQHKISIGVMTSFEMVRTSTVINKEILTTNENAQIQCNRSQISIKEVKSKSQSPNLNFLDGIAPVGETMRAEFEANGNVLVNTATPHVAANDEKTLNELSLYNVQVDNATTPLMSPEQSLYLDVKDYSE